MTESTSDHDRRAEDAIELQEMLRKYAPELADCGKDVLNPALRYLTNAEGEFIILRIKIGTKANRIMRRFGFASRQQMHYRWQSLMRIMRIYMEYFAKCKHRRAMKDLKNRMPKRQWKLLLDFFGRCPSDKIASRHDCSPRDVRDFFNTLRRGINSRAIQGDLAELIETTLKLSRFRRL